MPSLIDSIILALVIEKPSYGYELHERFGRRFGKFLSTSLANVYDALGRLEEDEYVEVAGRSGAFGRPRVNFQATAKGVEIHLSWLAERLREDPRRLALLSRLASTSLRRTDAMLRVIDRFIEECSLEARQIAMPACEDDLLCELFAEQRRRVVAAQLEWGAYARSKVLERAGRGEAEG
ncbi:MAG TPA: PadR family transcriptional regulator [Solirubrobacteraceae bacterium]